MSVEGDGGRAALTFCFTLPNIHGNCEELQEAVEAEFQAFSQGDPWTTVDIDVDVAFVRSADGKVVGRFYGASVRATVETER